MSFDLLVILGHRINALNWGNFSKQVFWTACTTSFFSSCRMGEILPHLENSFDPNTTVLWKNVVVTDEKDKTIFIPYSKTTGFKGKFIDIYPIKGNNICPSASLYKLKRMAESEGFGAKTDPFSLSGPANFSQKQS